MSYVGRWKKYHLSPLCFLFLYIVLITDAGSTAHRPNGSRCCCLYADSEEPTAVAREKGGRLSFFGKIRHISAGQWPGKETKMLYRRYFNILNVIQNVCYTINMYIFYHTKHMLSFWKTYAIRMLYNMYFYACAVSLFISIYAKHLYNVWFV